MRRPRRLSPPPQVVTDMPPPDPNPNRTTALPFAMKGTLTPAIAAPPPAMDYVAILKPILSYDLSDADEANIREVLRSGTAAAARIKDPAARDFALGTNTATVRRFRATPRPSSNSASRIRTGRRKTSCAKRRRRFSS